MVTRQLRRIYFNDDSVRILNRISTFGSKVCKPLNPDPSRLISTLGTNAGDI